MLQVRIGLSVGIAAAAGHAMYVRSERAKAPTGRLLQFSPGSQHDLVADTLKTGDLVVFSRDCSLYAGWSGLSCIARKQTSPYDHTGIIVVKQGTPHVAELTYSGVKMRRFDARVRSSRSKEILIRPLAGPLTKQQATDLDAWCTAKSLEHEEFPIAPLELISMIASPASNAAMNFVLDAYSVAGVGIDRRKAPSMKILQPPSQPLVNNSFLRDIWITDIR